ncbi:SpoIID/LytB domain-containing protein [[Clostridium] colinum]|uniref:SpoIID/LytB domain-containing protein n=1 Tax=[Clostridium] colinum TaxID=36835 RepID=UPI002024C980|nr:SpoIID/LytB domain-containing protein [[Clostridium] colinum]
MNKKLLFIICILCFTFVGCTKNSEEKNEELKIGVIGNNYPVDRATVSKMMALASYNKKEILALDNVINFKDVKEDSWYNKYINCAYIKGDMSGVLEDKFDPNGNLTITQTQYLINKYDKNKKIKIDDKNKDKPISYALWCNIYSQIIQDTNIQQEELVILATKDTNKSLKDDYVMTDKGLYSFEGIEVNKYINTKIKVFQRDNEVIAITDVIETEPTLKRCYIEKINKNYIDIFIGGAKKRLYIKDENIKIQEENIMADIKIKNDEIISIDYYRNTINGILNRIDNNTLRINNTNYVLDEDFKIYSLLNNQISMSNIDELLIGQNIASYFTKGNENKIYSAIINTSPKYDKIRVAINDTSYNNLYFNEIKLKANSGMKVLVKGQEKNLSSIHIKNNQDFGIGENEIIILESNNKDEGIIIENIKRVYELPTFYEKLEICKMDNKYVLVNEISIESYVESVLASDNNNYQNLEMLKTLAIIYRTQAIRYINENNLKHIGANLDDSSKYQIYNNKKSQDIFKQAVSETKGKIITNQNQVANLTYFSYSSGVTANSGEIWSDKSYYSYPSNNKPYLVHIKDFTENIYENLQEEVNANIFYKTKDIDSIEKDSKWFRWSTTLEEKDISKINDNIKQLYKTEKYFIKTLENDKYIYKPVEDIGKIKDINVKKRGDAGNIMELEIIGEKNTVLIMSDLIIKKVFSLNSVIDNNGEIVQNISTLPSSYFVFDKIYDNNGYLKKVTLYGGGYGHGVGLSMYGAYKMIQSGNTYEDVFHKYYKDIEIINIYN